MGVRSSFATELWELYFKDALGGDQLLNNLDCVEIELFLFVDQRSPWEPSFTDSYQNRRSWRWNCEQCNLFCSVQRQVIVFLCGFVCFCFLRDRKKDVFFCRTLSLERCHLSTFKLLLQCGACLHLQWCGQPTAALWDLLVWVRWKLSPDNWEGV